jgi:hypothetical protein
MLASDHEARKRDAWIELHRRPDAEPLPPLPEPTPGLARRLLSAVAERLHRQTAVPGAEASPRTTTTVGRRA